MAIVVCKQHGMEPGREAAQAAHAATLFFIEAIIDERPLSEVERLWIDTGITKVTLQVPDLSALHAVMEKAQQSGLRVWPFRDDCVDPNWPDAEILTCCAIGPDYREKVDLVTCNLALL